MQQRTNARVVITLVVTLLLWASAFAGIRAALVAYSPGHVAMLRFLVASVGLGIYALCTRMPLPQRRDLPAVLLIGFVGIAVYHVALNYGELSVTAGAASLLIATSPVFTALFAALFLREQLKIWGWVGIVVSFAGSALIALGEGEGDGLRFDPGALLILAASLAASVYTVAQKPYLQRYNALHFAAWIMWAGTLYMLVFVPGSLQAISAAPLGATLAVVFLGLFPGALAYITWTYVLSWFPASIASSFIYLIPILATLIAWGWLGEIPATISLVGGAVSLAGVVLVNTRGR